jgi:hypothetical protein
MTLINDEIESEQERLKRARKRIDQLSHIRGVANGISTHHGNIETEVKIRSHANRFGGRAFTIAVSEIPPDVLHDIFVDVQTLVESSDLLRDFEVRGPVGESFDLEIHTTRIKSRSQ